MPQILIATGNAGKFQEMMEFLHDIPHIKFLSLVDFNLQNDCEETGETFAENALQKAKYFYEKTGIPTIGEDSGIEVDALKGELGIKTRRWGAGEKASDTEWLAHFLGRMENESNRNAKFTSVMAFFDGENAFSFLGTCEGDLLRAPDTDLRPGIPLSSFFIPFGKEKSLARMTKEEKKEVSHRGKSALLLRAFLTKPKI